MSQNADRSFFLISLMVLVLVTGAFVWNTLRLERKLIVLRQEISAQTVRMASRAERPLPAPAAPVESPRPSPVTIAPKPPASEALPEERRDQLQAEQLQEETTQLFSAASDREREYQELQSRQQFIQNQLVILDSNGEQLKAQRLAQIDAQDQAIRDRIGQLEEANRRLKSQLLTLQAFSPGWPNTFQTTLTELSLQQQVSQGEQTIANLNAQRQELARIRLDRQLSPEPEILQARAEWERELASVQMRLSEKEQEVLAARERLAEAERTREDLEREAPEDRVPVTPPADLTPSRPAE